MALELTFKREGDALFALPKNQENDVEDNWVEVKIVYARPVSNRDGQISILNRDSKDEIGWINSLDELHSEQQTIIREELEKRYPVNLIKRIEHSAVNHGHRYLKVMTNRGFRYFNLREPGKNVTWLSDDRLVIRDSMGNRYEVTSIKQLDSDSQAHLDRVL